MLVDFIIPSHNRLEPLMSMLTSLLAQTDGDWRATVVYDFDEGNILQEISREMVMGLKINDDGDRIRMMFTDKRYNDWGHTPRELGKQSSVADYVLMGGDDNYYTPNFVAELKKATENKPGMVYWDMVHSHYDYSYFNCQPAYNQIDMGAFATRRDLAQQIKLGTTYAADGTYIEDFKKKFPSEQIKKINKVLFIHN